MPTSIIEDRVEAIGEWKIIHIRQATLTTNSDGVETNRTYHRRVVTPSDNVSAESDAVKALATEHHSSDLKTRYAAHVANPTGIG